MAQAAPTTVKKSRGTGFPVVSLPEAAKILAQAGKYGIQHAATAFAGYMGHKTTNSGAFRQRIAAMRDWKLITNSGDPIVMTEIGQAIALPIDSGAEAKALRQAFKNCELFMKVYEASAKGVPLDLESIGNNAVLNHGINAAAKQKFVSSLRDSAIHAGLAEVSEKGKITFLSESDSTPTDEPPPAQENGNEGPASGGFDEGRGVPRVHQTWQITGGQIVLDVSTSEPLPAAIFSKVGEVVLQLEQLAEGLQASVDSAQPTDASH